MTPTPGDSLPAARTWSPWHRALWWGKAIGIFAAALVSVAAAARALGVTIDIETRSEASVQHEQIKADMRDENNRALGRVEKAIDHLGDRIDEMMARGRK